MTIWSWRARPRSGRGSSISDQGDREFAAARRAVPPGDRRRLAEARAETRSQLEQARRTAAETARLRLSIERLVS